MDPKERIETLASSKVGYLKKRVGQGEAEPQLTADPQDVDAILGDWPDTPKKVAAKMIEQYGPPHEATPTRLIWHRNGPWKRSILFRDEIPHNFPTRHTDFLIQYLDYRVPVDKFDDLAAFDGSVIVDRTAGEMAARCDMEAMNILTLNLAHEIVTDERGVDEARKLYAEQASAHVMNRPAEYTERLLFEVPEGGTADLDESMIGGSMMRQAGEKVEDVVEERQGKTKDV